MMLMSVPGVVAFGVNWAIDALETFDFIVSDAVDVMLDIVCHCRKAVSLFHLKTLQVNLACPCPSVFL